jgi:predicted flap endonuclease-1-like 5' DNA nuclease
MRAAQLVILLCALLVASEAMASHYPLEAAPFIPEKERKALTAQKIADTEELLKAGLTAKARETLARKTSIKLETLTGWIYLCDLLRLRGVGPKMAQVLTLAGVKSVAELKGQEAPALLDRMKTANDKHAVSEIIPQVETVKDWIDQAKALEILVQE